MLRHIVVEIAGRVFTAPGVVAPINHGQLLIVADEDGAVVAAPGFIRGKWVEVDAGIERRIGFLERGPNVPLMLRGEDVDVDLLALREELGQPGPDGGNGFEGIWKADALGAGPSKPGGIVTRPLGRHAKTEGFGGGVIDGMRDHENGWS